MGQLREPCLWSARVLFGNLACDDHAGCRSSPGRAQFHKSYCTKAGGRVAAFIATPVFHFELGFRTHASQSAAHPYDWFKQWQVTSCGAGDFGL